METALKEINSILGVTGSFVCSLDGSLVATAMPDNFDAARLETAARAASQTFNALEASGQRVNKMDLLFDQNRLILNALRGGILAILCARNTSLPMLNLTAAGVAKRIAVALKPTQPAAVITAPPATARERAVPKTSVVGTTPSPALKIAPDSIAASPELANVRFFDTLTRELTRVMGAPASIIIEDEISALKATRDTFPKARTAELVERISEAIRDETKRERFQQVVLEAIRNL